MKRKKKNEDAGLIYEQTGMSQAALAQYIGAKQSTLSHHLAGSRLLPGEAGLELINIIVQLTQLPQPPTVQTLAPEEKAELQRAANWCRTQCIPLQQQLTAMRVAVAQANRLLQFVEIRQAAEKEMSEQRKRWYDGQRYVATTKLEKNNLYQQRLLRAKIEALQKEAEVYEALLKDDEE